MLCENIAWYATISQELIEEVGKYIDKYYEPRTDDIKMDEEMKSIFDKITSFRTKREKQKKQEICKEASADYETDMSAPAEFDAGSKKKRRLLEKCPRPWRQTGI